MACTSTFLHVLRGTVAGFRTWPVDRSNKKGVSELIFRVSTIRHLLEVDNAIYADTDECFYTITSLPITIHLYM